MKLTGLVFLLICGTHLALSACASAEREDAECPKVSRCVGEEEVVRGKPVRKWRIHLIHQTHLDIGFTHKQEDVLKRQVGFLYTALDHNAPRGNAVNLRTGDLVRCRKTIHEQRPVGARHSLC